MLPGGKNHGSAPRVDSRWNRGRVDNVQHRIVSLCIIDVYHRLCVPSYSFLPQLSCLLCEPFTAQTLTCNRLSVHPCVTLQYCFKTTKCVNFHCLVASLFWIFSELNYVLLFQWSPSVGSLRTGGFSCNSHIMDQNRARNACWDLEMVQDKDRVTTDN